MNLERFEGKASGTAAKADSSVVGTTFRNGDAAALGWGGDFPGMRCIKLRISDCTPQGDRVFHRTGPAKEDAGSKLDFEMDVLVVKTRYFQQQLEVRNDSCPLK
jgi:hypothetical protein